MTRAYTEAFRDGMRDACNGVSRAQAEAIANDTLLTGKQSGAYLAGYYAEIRKLNAAAERAAEDSDPAADRGDWRFHMDHDQ